MRFRLEVEGHVHTVELERRDRGWTVAIDERQWRVDLRPGAHAWSLLSSEGNGEPRAGARSHDVRLRREGADATHVTVDGTEVTVTVASVATAGRGVVERGSTDGTVRAPMPGRVVRVPVVAGQAVSARQTVVVVEAMKMENELRAPRAGTVRALHVGVGDPVDVGQLLVDLDT